MATISHILTGLLVIAGFSATHQVLGTDQSQSTAFLREIESLPKQDKLRIRAKAAKISPETTRVLFNLAKSTTIRIRSQSQLEKAKWLLCGRSNDTYEEIFAEINEGQLDFDVSPEHERELVFPACPFVGARAITSLQEGSTITELTKSRIGSVEAPVYQTVMQASSIVDETSITPKTLIELPFTSEIVEIELREDLARDDSTRLISTLALAPELNLSTVAEASEVSVSLPAPSRGPASVTPDKPSQVLRFNGPIANHIVGAQPNLSDGVVCEGVSEPIDFDTLKKVLAFNEAMRTQLGIPPLENLPVVSVVDSGIDGYGTTFDKALFRHSLDFINNVPDDSNGYTDDLIGVYINRQRTGIPNAYRNYEIGGDHGTHVAGIILGGYEFKVRFPEVKDRLRLQIINTVTEGLSPTGEPAYYYTPEVDLEDSINYASANAADIINVSFGYPVTRPKIVRWLIENDTGVLLVAAAGNEGGDVDDVGEFPAKYGGVGQSSLHNVISVASHDADYELLTTSTRSASRVDLAAPGCLINSFSFDGKSKKVSGTSQAAPFVTLTAALLHSEGMTNSHDLKKRILTSATHRPGLANKVLSDGSLNIVDALDIYRDSYRVNGGKANRGNIELPEGVTCLRQDQKKPLVYSKHNVRKLYLKTDSENGSEFTLHLENSGGELIKKECISTNLADGFWFIPTEGSRQKIELKKGMQIVFALKGPNFAN